MIGALLLAATISCVDPYVIDGDTIVCADQRVRIYGIDAPEIAHPRYGKFADQPGGLAAKARMVQLAHGKVLCTTAGDQYDRYGRMVAKCASHISVDMGRQLLREGYACEWRRYDHGEYAGVGRVCDR